MQNPLLDLINRKAKRIESISYTIEIPIVPAPGFYLEPPESKGESEAFSDLDARHERGVQAVANAVNVHLDSMMASNWGWIDGSRDIIDTGELRDSAQIGTDGRRISVSYNTPYANLVHYGGYIYPYGNVNIERVYLPGRPWVDATFGIADGPMGPVDWMTVYKQAVN